MTMTHNLVGMYNYSWSLSNSSDGNLSWTPRLFPSGIADGFPFDPWANPGNDSAEFFATLIRYHPTLSSVTHCIIGRSIDAGANFSLFFERTRNTFQDREMVDIDRTEARGGGSGTTHDGKVYLTYDDFPGGGSYNASYLQIISPAGAPLLEIQTSGISGNPPNRGYQMQPVAGITDGTFYLKAKKLSYNGVRIHEITNGGAGPNTFDKSILSWTDVGQELGSSGRPGVNGHRVDINGYLDIDRSFGPRRGYLYLISNRNPHPSDTTQDQGDVYLSVSTNGASSWSSAILPTASGKTQYFPMLNIDQSGWIHVAYYQNDTGTVDGGVLNATAANLFYLFSYDGGNTWSAPVQVNDNANTLDYNDPPLDLSPAYYLIGDYAQIRVAETDSTKKAYLLWSGYDKDAWTKVFCTTLEYDKCWAKPGNANGTDPIALPDVIHLANYVFDKDRPATSCLGSSPGNCWSSDPVCQGEVNGAPPIALPDVIHLANYVFDKDRPATSCLGSSPGNCWLPVATGACCLPVP